MLFASGVIVALLFGGTTISMLLPLDGDEELDPISETPPGAPQNDAFDNLDLLDAINATGESLVTGTSGSDLLEGDDANNLISSWGGDDVVLVGKGNDTIYLGRGDDVGFGQGGNDRIQGADGDDIIRGNWGNDTLTGDAGSDYLVGGPGADVLRGGSDEDVLLGNGGEDTLYGGADNDALYGQGGKDTLFGNQGDDVLFGGDQKDLLFGGAGTDVLVGGTWADRLDGGGGDDLILGERGSDVIFGRGGDDLIIGGIGEDTIDPGPGVDVVLAAELENQSDNIIDTDQGDVISLTVGENLVVIGTNDDVMIEGGSNTLLIGDFVQPGDGQLPPVIEGMAFGSNVVGFLHDQTKPDPVLELVYDEDLLETEVRSNGKPVLVLVGGDFTGDPIPLIPYAPELVAEDGILKALQILETEMT